MPQIVPTEAEEGKAFVAYLRIKGYRFHHSANETGSGKGAVFQGIRNKQQGVSKGFPDYQIWLKDGTQVYIELKRIKGSSTSAEQKEWIKFFQDNGDHARICKGYYEAVQFIQEVESGKHNT